MAPLRRSVRALLSPFYSSFIIVLLVVIIALHLLPPPPPLRPHAPFGTLSLSFSFYFCCCFVSQRGEYFH